MLAAFLVSIYAVIFAVAENNTPRNKKYFYLSFLVIFLFLALRYDFGNDYMTYYNYFSHVHDSPLNDLLNFRDYRYFGFMEIGFTFLNKLFPSFYLMIVILALFSCYTYYSIINLYVAPNLKWLSVFLFLFAPGLMLTQSTAIRQSIAICIFLLSVRFLINRNIWKYILLICIGGLFHRSAFILLPMYFIANTNKWSKGVLLILVGFYAFLAFFGNILLVNIENIMDRFFPLYSEFYKEENVGNQLASGLGFLVNSIIFLFVVWSHGQGEVHNTIASKLSMMYFMLTPIGMFMNMFGRILMYFDPFIILTLPFAISLLKSRQLRISVISVIIVYYIYLFLNFFQDPVWIEKFLNYKTILIDGI